MIDCIIQARMDSSRLPNKVLLKIDDADTVLDCVIKQLGYCKQIDKIVVATTTSNNDNKIEEHLRKIGIPCFRGSELYVLDRYYQCAKKFSFSTIVRITSDNPLIDPVIVDKVITKFQSDKFDYVSNTINRTYPYGTEVEAFSFKTLEIIWKNSKKPSEREHVTPYIYNNLEKFQTYNVENPKNLSHFRWTVDRENDLQLVKLIISKITKRPILMNDILELIKKDKKLIEINKNNVSNEGYLKSLNDEKNFLNQNIE